MTSRLAKARRIVVKIGSALLVDGKTGAIKASWLSSLIDDLADLRVGGAEVANPPTGDEAGDLVGHESHRGHGL